jgi:hypothetical protein
MALSAAAGYPQHSGVLIPEIWSGKLLVKFYAATVASAISNSDYEGEIKNVGDKVIIRTVPDITIRPYVKGQSLVVDHPEGGTVELLIDRADVFNIAVDDIDQWQADIPFMEKWTDDASQQMKIEQDRIFLGSVYADADDANKGTAAGKISGSISLGATGSAVALTKANIVDFLVDVGTVLDEQNVPETDRKLVLPSWATALIKKSELRDASLSGDGVSTTRNGRIGQVDRFEIYTSNLLSSVADGGNTCYNALACHKSALTWAAQLVKTETIKAESTFGHIARGLQVYGFKAIKPESLAHLYIRKG